MLRHSNSSHRIGLFDYPEKKTAETLYEYSERFGAAENDDVYVTPSGGIFVGKRKKQGVLPKMLEELLETRAMIKRAMKAYKNSPKGEKLLRNSW